MSEKTELNHDLSNEDFEAIKDAIKPQDGWGGNDWDYALCEAAINFWNRRATIQPTAATCSKCNGTGHIHNSRGQYYGKCNCTTVAPVAPADAVRDAARWISVAERLPEDTAFVAIYDPENEAIPVRTSQWLAGSKTFESEMGWLAQDEATHWMPLPSTPTDTPKEPAK